MEVIIFIQIIIMIGLLVYIEKIQNDTGGDAKNKKFQEQDNTPTVSGFDSYAECLDKEISREMVSPLSYDFERLIRTLYMNDLVQTVNVPTTHSCFDAVDKDQVINMIVFILLNSYIGYTKRNYGDPYNNYGDPYNSEKLTININDNIFTVENLRKSDFICQENINLIEDKKKRLMSNKID